MKSDTLCHNSSADIKIQSAARRKGFFANFKLSWQKRQLGDRGGSKRKKRKRLLRAGTIAGATLKVRWFLMVGVLTVTRPLQDREK